MQRFFFQALADLGHLCTGKALATLSILANLGPSPHVWTLAICTSSGPSPYASSIAPFYNLRIVLAVARPSTLATVFFSQIKGNRDMAD